MSRLSIDEVIEHCDRQIKRIESIVSKSFLLSSPINAVKEYWEHVQVKEWLQELKELQELFDEKRNFTFPVGIGQIVYEPSLYFGGVVTRRVFEVSVDEHGTFWIFTACGDRYEWNKDVFTEKETAEEIYANLLQLQKEKLEKQLEDLSWLEDL